MEIDTNYLLRVVELRTVDFIPAVVFLVVSSSLLFGLRTNDVLLDAISSQSIGFVAALLLSLFIRGKPKAERRLNITLAQSILIVFLLSVTTALLTIYRVGVLSREPNIEVSLAIILGLTAFSSQFFGWVFFFQ